MARFVKIFFGFYAKDSNTLAKLQLFCFDKVEELS